MQRTSVSLERNLAVRTRAAAAAAKHYAVVGAGLAGLATVYHLLKQNSPGHAVHVTMVDAVGIGAGGSGAAAGLLHPFSPKGKLLWKAQEAMASALQLLQAAEEAAAQCPDLPQPLAWHTGMLRPAPNTKQSQDYWKVRSSKQQQQQQQGLDAGAVSVELALLQASIADAAAAQQLLPGVVLPAVSQAAADAHAPSQQQQDLQPHLQRRRQGKQQQEQLEGWTSEGAAALHIPGGITLHPQRYMRALWSACQLAAAARADGSSTALHIQQLSSLAELQQALAGSSSSSGESRKLDAIVVAAGAAVGSLTEFDGQLPLSLCQGYTLDMLPPLDQQQQQNHQQQQADSAEQAVDTGSSSSSSTLTTAAAALPNLLHQYGAEAPSLLGSPYLASQGGQVLVVGATKQHDWTAQQALQELGRAIHPSILQQQDTQQQQQQQLIEDAAEVRAAAKELLAGAAAAWPPLSGWRVGGIRSGVRALPPRTQQGSVPLAGRWTSGKQQQQQQQQQEPLASEIEERRPAVWLLVGLGARGLVYHAWLGQLMAQAVLAGSEQQLPQELLAWRQLQAAGGATAGATMQEAE